MKPNKSSLFWHDSFLILAMAILAGCGLIYEYLLSHYAGRVLGAMESTIYAMIGLMIVAMGLGAFAARNIKCAFNGFVWLELTIAILGSLSILIIGGFIAITQTFPLIISDMFSLPPDALPRGGIFKQLSFVAFNSPYFFGFLLGFFIGMEIPLIARIREEIHEKHLKNNIGTIYGADYIGAGIGAAIWVLFLLTIDISKASALTAALNLLVGTMFIAYYWHKLNWKKTIVSLHIILFIIVGVVYQQGNTWLNQMSNLLYIDKVVYTDKTRFQQLTFTQRYMGAEQSNVISFYLNGRLQFTSSDEFIYHSYLVTPVLAGSARHDNILIVGGGDGLALRDVLQWSPEHVTLIDLDDELIDIFTTPEDKLPPKLAKHITELNQKSLQDKKVNVIKSDAFIAIDELLAQGKVFDAIIVDLPDPSHPDLNKLYSVNFYARLKQMLAGDGLIGVQSTSPYHAKNSFISVLKTLEAANYSSVQQYHDNVPSFGEWGWTIASKMGASPLQRLQALDTLPVEHFWLTLPMIKSSFEFPHNFYREKETIPINYLGSHAIYQLHQNAWQDQQGLNNSHLQQ
ncbi:polyamine aminopropyltransferase [Pseudocolwellia sp. HL-MZ19]|uniref:polyamine aminopropyltransferase n=1 Tax=unclassified Pseudocolwellia TaxID=2848178 RepID=UPI003CEE3820